MKFVLLIMLLVLVSCEYQFNETEQGYFTDQDIEFYYETDNVSYLLIQTDTILEQAKIQINNDNPKSPRFNRVIGYIEVSEVTVDISDIPNGLYFVYFTSKLDSLSIGQNIYLKIQR